MVVWEEVVERLHDEETDVPVAVHESPELVTNGADVNAPTIPKNIQLDLELLLKLQVIVSELNGFVVIA